MTLRIREPSRFPGLPTRMRDENYAPRNLGQEISQERKLSFFERIIEQEMKGISLPFVQVDAAQLAQQRFFLGFLFV